MKQKLLILHGALGAASQISFLKDHFSPYFDCFNFEFAGHGERSGKETEFSISLFSKDLLEFIDKNDLNGCRVFGYSMGGYVALYTEAKAPGTFSHVITFATKFAWDPDTANKEAGYLDPLKLEAKVPDYAAFLKKLHGENWRNVLGKTAAMMRALGNSPELNDHLLGSIKTKVMICLGDSDKMVSLEETVRVKNRIARAALFVMPETPHPLEKIRFENALPVFMSFLAR